MKGSSNSILAPADAAEDADELEKALRRGLLLSACSDSFRVAERPSRPGLDMIVHFCGGWKGDPDGTVVWMTLDFLSGRNTRGKDRDRSAEYRGQRNGKVIKFEKNLGDDLAEPHFTTLTRPVTVADPRWMRRCVEPKFKLEPLPTSCWLLGQ